MTERRHDDDRVAQYVAGTLPPDDIDEFEQHLLSCAECRGAVRLGAMTHAALVTGSGAERPRRLLRLAWLPMAAAVVVAVVLAQRDDVVPSLGSVEPAPFVAGPLRPSFDSVTALVDSGMRAYQDRDYDAAAARLARAARSDPSPSTQFFLGVSHLLRGDDRSARLVLARVPLESPYGIEATYYSAKALVRLDSPDSALALLDRVIAANPEAATLRAFADSLKRP